MLTSETKQKINNCRDYLVGKVPDPKSQIDQITNALIYKFMSDQDTLAVEIWGKASFFVEDYAQYSWKNLFDTTLTNEQKAKLYIAGIEQLSKAKHLPELFRDIFKDAFLPFRDSNTIVLFLTEINKFDYHHSEELGNAFEYLLSIMWSQWNAGQFRTPRHIIDFLVDVVDPKPGETIYDPACGTAGFLISAFTHILENNPKLSIPEKLELYKNISWVDIDPGMAKIARVNLYLHGFKTPKISENDTLSNSKLWEDKYDVILANPPFMTPKWGIKPHEWYSIKSTKAEVLFTDYIAEHLKLKWRAWIIVPEWIIFQSANAYKDLRKMLIEQKLLYAVVSLPSWVFNPYSWVKTSILFLDRELAKKSDKVLFVKVENDWYDLWAQRREINKNDLPKVLETLNKYKKSISENKVFETEDKNILVVGKSKIAENGEYNLSWERYRETIVWNSSFEMVELGEVCELVRWITYWKNDEVDANWFKVLRANNINKNNSSLYLDDIKQISKDLKLNNEKILRKNDIFICLASWSKDHIWKVAFIENNTDYYFWWFMWAVRIIDENKLLPKYLFYQLSSWKFNKYINSQIAWANINNLSWSIMNIYKIPLPPLEIQEQIVAELDNYQKIIDGAKQIVENYKPKIKIDESWEVVELGEVCDVISWQSPESKFYNEEWNGLPFFQWKTEFTEKYIWSPRNWTTQITKESIKWDILMSVRAPVWPVNINIFDKICIWRWLCAIRVSEKVLLEFIFNYLLWIQEKIKWNWWAVFDSISRDDIKRIKIPLPPLEIQEQIVAKIEEEQKMVESAKWLIEVFENKIKERIGEVWGEK